MLSSQRQDEAESQPFFKPSSQSQSSSNSSFFLFGERETSRSTPTSIFQDPGSQMQQASTTKTTLLMTPSLCTSPGVSNMPETHHYQQHQQQQQKQQQQQQQQQELCSSTDGPDHVSTLHTRLFKEADKIRNWKVQTEMELKQKERKLHDAQFTIESQKKSILELQLQNENLSRKLKEEMDNRSEISERIESTRDMCNLLKDYTTKMQDRMAMCESDRDELKEVEKQNLEDLEELRVMFKDLSLLHSNKVNDLILALESEKNSNLKSNEELIGQLREVQQKLKDLERQLAEKEENIQQLTLKKKEITQQLGELKQENTSLHKTLTEAVEKVRTQADLLDQADAEKLEMQNNNEQLNNEKTELHQAIQLHKEHIEELKQNIVSLNECIDQLKADKDKLSAETQTLKESLTAKLEKIDDLKDQLQVVTEREKASLDKVDSAEKETEDERKEKEKLQELLNAAQTKTQSLDDHLRCQEDELHKLRTNLETLQKTAEGADQKLKAVVENNTELKGKIEVLKETQKKQDLSKLQELEEEKIRTDNLNKDLEAINKQSTSLENKNKTLQGQITTKTKQVKDLQQELKTLKGKLTTQTKLTTSSEEQVSCLTQELEETKASLTDVREKFTSATEDLEKKRETVKELETKVTEIEKQAKDKADTVVKLEAETVNLRQQTEKAVKEHEEAKQACELQITEVSNILDRYKAENERMVDQQEEEIEQLKKEIEQQKHNKKLQEDQVSQLEKDMQHLKKQLNEVQTERDKAVQELIIRDGDIKSLKENIKEKDNRLQQMKNAANPMGDPMSGISPIAPKRSSSLPKHSTPKLPAQQIPHTPKTQMSVDMPLPVTPSKYKTTQHSILRHAVSATRKRHVAFASDEEDSADGSFSDSSSSQLMEIEPSEIERRIRNIPCQLRPSQTVVPLHVTSSRRTTSNKQETPKASRTSPHWLDSKETQPVPKGKTYLKPKKMRPQADEAYPEMTGAELSRFKELYPEEKVEMNPSTKPKGKQTPPPSSNIRKTNRIFKAKGVKNSVKTPKKSKGKSAKPKENDLSWLEMDAVYGFIE